MWFAVRGRWRQMILLFLIVRRTPTIRELIVATPLSLSSPSVTGLSAHAPAQRLERSDFVLGRKASVGRTAGTGGKAGVTMASGAGEESARETFPTTFDLDHCTLSIKRLR